jgi:hypothetical protein
MRACQCARCGREFTGLTAFDRHQDVSYKRRPAVLCKDPATAGLVRQKSGRWGLPIDPAARERLRQLRASAGNGGKTFRPSPARKPGG